MGGPRGKNSQVGLPLQATVSCTSRNVTRLEEHLPKLPAGGKGKELFGNTLAPGVLPNKASTSESVEAEPYLRFYQSLNDSGKGIPPILASSSLPPGRREIANASPL